MDKEKTNKTNDEEEKKKKEPKEPLNEQIKDKFNVSDKCHIIME